MNLIDILLAILIITASALCIALIFYIWKISNAIKAMQADISELSTNIQPFLNSTTELSTVGLTEISEDEISFNIYPTISSSNATIELDFKNGQSDVQLELYDPAGKKLSTIFEGRAAIGVQTFEINKSMVNSDGLYFVRLQTDKAVSTKKIIFQ